MKVSEGLGNRGTSKTTLGDRLRVEAGRLVFTVVGPETTPSHAPELEPIAGEQPTRSMRVSVVVSTHGRADRLPRLVAALEAQTISRDVFEVVIVDDGSPDATPQVLRELAEASPLALRAVRTSPSRGPAAGRNTGWRLAVGEIVAFTDDDCQPTPSWLEEGMKALDGDRIVVGRTMPDPAQRGHQGAFSRTMRVEDTRNMPTCNMFYRRSDLEAVGGFDEGFPTPGGEDTDLGIRVRDELGCEVVFAPEALVHHDIRPSSFAATLRETWRWVGIPRVVALHPQERHNLLHRGLFWKRSHPKTLFAAAGLALAGRWPITLVLALPYVYWRTAVRPRRSRSRVHRIALLPGTFAIDLLEVVVMIRASVQNRTIVL